MLPIVAGTFSPNGTQKLEQWQTQMMSYASGQVNSTTVSIMRDTGYTVCMVGSSLVKPEQMTGLAIGVCWTMKPSSILHFLTVSVDGYTLQTILHRHS